MGSNMPRPRFLRALVSASLGLVVGWGCQADDTTSDASSSEATAYPSEFTLSSVHYALSFSQGRATMLAEGGFSVTNDLGYEVTIQSGYLVTYSASLIHCHDETDSLALFSLGIRSAYAGHSGISDFSAMEIPHVESLTAPVALDLGTIGFPAATYCQLHYLIARADDDAVGMPEDADMDRISLRVSGHYRAPGGADALAFDLSTSAANGSVTDLGPLLEGADCEEGAGLDVTVERDLGTLFDGAELDQMSDDALASRLLENLITHARITASCI